jgi:hypothetical protein
VHALNTLSQKYSLYYLKLLTRVMTEEFWQSYKKNKDAA